MGGIISRWRKKPTPLELLEKLDTDIANLEQLKRSNLEKQKKIIGSLLIYSVLLYIVGAVAFYFLYFPAKWGDRVMYSSPLLVFPFIVWFLKRFLHWYFVKRITGNDGQLERFKDERSKILEEVMEKETYKKAREILERFDPERFKTLETPPSTPAPQRAPIGQELRQRGSKPAETPASTAPVGTVRPTPRISDTPSASCPTTPSASHRTTQQQKSMIAAAAASAAKGGRPCGPPGPPMVRPVLPRERSVVDRLMEYLVGDGPQNRYALICKNCYSHNGMALKEEFEYIAFRCCYCHTPNPPRKRRPSAPRLSFDTPMLKHRAPHNTQDDIDENKELEINGQELEKPLPMKSLKEDKNKTEGKKA